VGKVDSTGQEETGGSRRVLYVDCRGVNTDLDDLKG
jgi:hypothetical protein